MIFLSKSNSENCSAVVRENSRPPLLLVLKGCKQGRIFGGGWVHRGAVAEDERF